MRSKRMMLSRNQDHGFDLILQQAAASFRALSPEEQSRIIDHQRRSAGRSVFPRDGK